MLDKFLQDINKMNEGAFFSITRIALVAYADNMILTSNSYEGLNKLYKEFK